MSIPAPRCACLLFSAIIAKIFIFKARNALCIKNVIYLKEKGGMCLADAFFML
jgi:hypothetical protein